jgi:hypothetical protein
LSELSSTQKNKSILSISKQHDKKELIVLSNKSNLLYVVDMGLAKRYFDPNS